MVPAWVMAGGIAATVLIGATAGLYPAVRASRLPPTEALTNPQLLGCCQAEDLGQDTVEDLVGVVDRGG